MFKRTTTTFLATVFVAIVCLSLLVVDGWRSWNARAVELLQAEHETANLARAMAQQADDAFNSADTALIGIVERVEVDGVGPAALQRLHLLLMKQVKNLTQLNGLLVYDETGKWLVNSAPILVRSMNNADREYFIFHRTHPERGAHVGVPVLSRSTGKWVIPVSRRIDRADGSFAGVVLATIDIDYFKNFYQSFNIGKKGAVALVSNSGTLLMRRPLLADTIGRSVLTTQLFRAYSSIGPTGSAFFKSALDGEMRMYSYRALDRYPLFVTAALAKDETLADWRSDTMLHSGFVLLLATLMALFGRHLIRQIGLREKAEQELLGARDELQSVNQTLARHASQDALTGLANRRQFDMMLKSEWARAQRDAGLLAFVMIDVDHFKQYNDLYGHPGGDQCLREVSAAILGVTPKRPGDLAARYGGEEICLLLPSTGQDGAMTVAEKVRQAVASLKIPHRGSPSGIVTVSAGVAAFIPRSGDVSDLIVRAADQALYGAKSDGRNRVKAWTGSAHPARLYLAETLPATPSTK